MAKKIFFGHVSDDVGPPSLNLTFSALPGNLLSFHIMWVRMLPNIILVFFSVALLWDLVISLKFSEISSKIKYWHRDFGDKWSEKHTELHTGSV